MHRAPLIQSLLIADADPLASWKARQLDLLRNGPIAFDPEDQPPPMTGINPAHEALMALVRSGEAEIDHDLCVIRLRKAKVEKSTKALPYEKSPAILAMRARRKALGR